MKALWDLLRESFVDWREDDAGRLAAALSYYAIFSLAPLLVLVIAVSGMVFPEELVQHQLRTELRGLVGEEGAEMIQSIVRNARRSDSGALATLVGMVALVLGATGVFGQLQHAMNTVWEVRPKSGRGITGIVRDRFASFTMVLGVCFLLMVSLVVSALLTAAQELVLGSFRANGTDQVINFLVSFVVISLLFALIFKVLPDVRIQWRDVWIGATVTSLFFNVGKLLIGFYLGTTAVTSWFGAAGALAIILLWVYYSSQILFFGAEFTQVYARRYGSRIVPDEGAVPIGSRLAKQGDR